MLYLLSRRQGGHGQCLNGNYILTSMALRRTTVTARDDDTPGEWTTKAQGLTWPCSNSCTSLAKSSKSDGRAPSTSSECWNASEGGGPSLIVVSSQPRIGAHRRAQPPIGSSR